MNVVFRSLVAVVVAMSSLCVRAQVQPLGTADSNDALVLVGKIPVPDMTGTWDHLTVDTATGRLFASAQEDNQVRVFDLHARTPLYTISGGLDRPQGLLYVPGANALAVSNGKDGTLRAFDGKTYASIRTVPLSLGADMMVLDAKTRDLYVDHGGVDSNRGPGGLAIVNSKTWEKVGEVPTEYRPGSLEIDPRSERLFVLIPALSQVGVVDRSKGDIVARYPVAAPSQPIALTLDEAGHRLFVANRRPSTFRVLDMDDGHLVATMDVIDGVESMFFDTKLHRLYMTALDGNVQVVQQIDKDHYKTIALFPTGHHAGTSQFVANMNLLCVAVPPVDGQQAAIWLFQSKP